MRVLQQTMAEYAPASGQDRNSHFYSNPSVVSPHYTNGNGINYFHPQFPQGHVPYSGTASCSTYPTHYMPTTQQLSHPAYMPGTSSMGMQYHLTPPPSSRPYTQSRTLSYPPSTGYHTGTLPTQRMQPPSQHRLTYTTDLSLATEIESQESVNEQSMLSEPILPPLEGYPDVKEFDRLVQKCVDKRAVSKHH